MEESDYSKQGNKVPKKIPFDRASYEEIQELGFRETFGSRVGVVFRGTNALPRKLKLTIEGSCGEINLMAELTRGKGTHYNVYVTKGETPRNVEEARVLGDDLSQRINYLATGTNMDALMLP